MYVPRFSGNVIQPQTRYNLTVRIPDGRIVTATTLTPRRISVSGWVILDDNGVSVIDTLKTFPEAGDSVYYQPQNTLVYSKGLLEARLNNTGYEALQVALFSLDDGSPPVIDTDIIDEEDLERTGASPPFLDLNVRLPWFAIAFEGRYLIRLFAMDRNWFDLARSLPELSGGGSFAFGGSPGDAFDFPIFHINGGIGLFGSASADSNGVFILPRNAAPPSR
jgi:hypothetical protein